jgi:hypothetical protein
MSRMKPIDEALFARMWQAGERSKAIGLAVGIHPTSVAKRAAKMNITKPEPEGGLGPRAKVIDRARFTQMWIAGTGMGQICAVFGLAENAIRSRVDAFGLERCAVGGKRQMVTGGKPNSKPVADPKPVAEPAYRPGLSDAIKRAKLAGDPFARLGKVATVYGMKYREVLEMAGVQA